MRKWLPIVLLGLAAPVWGQVNDPVRINESFAKDAQYHVNCEVEIAGTLTIAAGGKEPRPLRVAGRSWIKYDERILKLDVERKVERTVRFYRQLEFDRKVGDEEQHNKLRPEAARLVILRHNQYEVPFCPTAPLTWGEIELVRTDVFSPALAGLFPTAPVRAGERWKASNAAVQELTDVEKIDKAELTCTLEKITTTTFNGRRTAHVRFDGKVHGIGEDGNALHVLRGSYYFDLDANFLSYVYVKGTHHLLDKAGNETGKIEGTFVMTRDRTPVTSQLGDKALAGLVLEPSVDNTLLLFDHPQAGVRFAYPRNWRVAGFNEKQNQLGIDETRGSGVLLTLSPANGTPTGAQFLQETKQWLVKENAKVFSESKVQALAGGLETFSFDAEVAQKRVHLQYFVLRQGNAGVTMTARLLPGDLARTQRDVEHMAKSLQLRQAK